MGSETSVKGAARILGELELHIAEALAIYERNTGVQVRDIFVQRWFGDGDSLQNYVVQVQVDLPTPDMRKVVSAEDEARFDQETINSPEYEIQEGF